MPQPAANVATPQVKYIRVFVSSFPRILRLLLNDQYTWQHRINMNNLEMNYRVGIIGVGVIVLAAVDDDRFSRFDVDIRLIAHIVAEVH